ncbi:MAG: hypothetical protein GY771_00430 [bacterium]|nr:hypothetical protein [bacterium]
MENAYHTVKRDNCYGIDKVFAEYPNEIDTSYAYFVRFRIRPDGSVRDVDIINRKFGHREINVIGDDEKYSYGVGLPDGFNTDGLEKALLSEMGGWRFPESEGDITHYCWLYYRDY